MMNECAQVRRRLAASPERVYAAFAQPAMVSRWLRPSPEVELTVRHFDFREGGHYEFVYLVPDGTRMIVEGTFTQLKAPSKLVFTWVIEPPDVHAGIESIVVVSIDPDGTGSVLEIKHLNLGRPDAIARHSAGWRGAVGLLESMTDPGPHHVQV
jgi:uncharacterized protein YndB with AHSA1/START domain